jgi:hypothetical protein
MPLTTVGSLSGWRQPLPQSLRACPALRAGVGCYCLLALHGSCCHQSSQRVTMPALIVCMLAVHAGVGCRGRHGPACSACKVLCTAAASLEVSLASLLYLQCSGCGGLLIQQTESGDERPCSAQPLEALPDASCGCSRRLVPPKLLALNRYGTHGIHWRVTVGEGSFACMPSPALGNHLIHQPNPISSTQYRFDWASSS